MEQEVEYVNGYATIINQEKEDTDVSCPYCGKENIRIKYGQLCFVCPACNQSTAVYRSRETLERQKLLEEKDQE